MHENFLALWAWLDERHFRENMSLQSEGKTQHHHLSALPHPITHPSPLLGQCHHSELVSLNKPLPTNAAEKRKENIMD